MELLPVWISQYGYAGLFVLLVLGIVGLPIPDETLLAFAGYLVFKGRLAFGPTLLSAFLGSVTGITISYLLGRGPGMFLLHKFGPVLRIHHAQMEQTQQWFARRGKFLLMFGYFIPGVRHLTALVAGSSGLRVGIFALYAYVGALIWSLSFITLGYFLEERWTALSATIHSLVITITAIFITVLLGYFLWRRIHRRNATPTRR
jgi:membrane protein DedA with SNARE-associated domain